MSTRNPPRLARRLLSIFVPREDREGIIGDLDEVYRNQQIHDGESVSRGWYWKQAIAISTRFLGESVRDLSPTRLMSTMTLDLKLGFRMLIKYPLLTLVGGLAITVTATIGLAGAEFMRDMLSPDIPLDDGNRIVRIATPPGGEGDYRISTVYDLQMWRESAHSLTDVSGFTAFERGLVTPEGKTSSVVGARMSASAFELTRVPALLGRYLNAADERPGAPPVVVIGFETWQDLFDGNAHALGQTLQVGGVPTTVVGVMPEGYRFPTNQNVWLPLQVESAAMMQPEGSPTVQIVGRLADGVSLEAAKAELELLGKQATTAYPGTPEVHPEVRLFSDVFGGGGWITLANLGVQSVFIVFLLIAGINVATLVFARAVTREGEIAVRMSLGATRRRIVSQMFIEALVLVSGSMLIAMSIAGYALERVAKLFFTIQQAGLAPFWWDYGLSLRTIVFGGVLTLVGAFMVGVIPALKATRGDVRDRLTQLVNGGAQQQLRFGGGWTVVIVLQLALSVAFLPFAVSVANDPLKVSTFPAGEFVTAQLGRDAVASPRSDAEWVSFLVESKQMFDVVRERVAQDPAVEQVAFASGLSAMNHVIAPVEFVGDGTAAPISSGGVRVLLVDDTYLQMMGAEVVAGRGLEPADADGFTGVLVNQAYVDNVLLGANAVGGQLRFPERDGESSEVTIPEAGTSVQIVGVVKNPGIDDFGPGVHPVIYAPLSWAPVTPRAVGLVGMPQAPAVQMFLKLRPEAESIAGRLYTTVGSVDPSLRLSELATVEDAWGPVHTGNRLFSWIFAAVAGCILMLSVAGIYALMSFTVSQRRREIAIRNAVGAGPGRVIRAIFARAIVQLGLGIGLGCLIGVPILWTSIKEDGPRDLLIVAGILGGAGLIACLIPLRRALAIQPIEAIKSS